MPSWHLLGQSQKASAEKIVIHSSKEGFFCTGSSISHFLDGTNFSIA